MCLNEVPVPKYVTVKTNGPDAINKFKTFVEDNINENIVYETNHDPNENYNIIEGIIATAIARSFPSKKVKYKKDRHKKVSG